MNEFMDFLPSIPLFRGIEPDELTALLSCLGAEMKRADRGEILLMAGDEPRQVGTVLSGRLTVYRDSRDGNRSLLANLAPGGIYAEALCCAGVPESPVSVRAEAESAVLLLAYRRILHNCAQSCPYHTRLIENMLRLVAEKNLLFQRRMEIICQKSIRAKVLAYLEDFPTPRGREIVIPFNREALADFLCADRSALSHELAKMKKEGLLDYKGNRFVLENRD